jgi:hypothetical protein
VKQQEVSCPAHRKKRLEGVPFFFFQRNRQPSFATQTDTNKNYVMILLQKDPDINISDFVFLISCKPNPLVLF